MSHLQHFTRSLLIIAAGIGLAGAAHASEPYEAFLTKYCIHCHGPDHHEGELRIDTLSRDFALGGEAHRWAEVIERVNAGDMPPEGEPQPTQAEIETLVTKLDSLIRQGRAARMAARPPVSHYRLSRKEYQNTVYDLLGVHYDPTEPGQLNEDTLWHGYERIGSELSLSPSHVERYYRAAEVVLDRALPEAARKTQQIRKDATFLRYRRDHGHPSVQEGQGWLDRLGIERPLRNLLYAGHYEDRHPALYPDWFDGPPQSGLYRVRLQASGIRPPGGRPAHLRIGRLTASTIVEGGLIEFDVTAPEDEPQIYEFEVPLEMPTKLYFAVVATEGVSGGPFKFAMMTNIFTHSSENRQLNPTAPQMFDEDGNGIFSSVIIDWIEWEGPLETEAEKSLRKDLLPPEDATSQVVANHLRRFAQRAWRRPVKLEELTGYLAAYEYEREAGESEAEAFRVAMKGVLTSRHFIYLVEGEPQVRERLNDWELASRLSYFLWSSMPDNGLFLAGRDGALTGDGLNKEVDRMLTDSRINRFTEDFSR